VKGWQKALVTTGAVGLGILAARYGWFRRVRFPDHWRVQVLDNPEHPHPLAFVHLRQGHERLVIVAHGALQSMNQPGIARLARVLQERFDVILFDFRGHGRSGGASDLNFLHAAEDLRRMIAYARQQGYRRIGLWGYSMGAAAALLAAAQGETVEAIVCICCPVKPSLRNTRSFAISTRPWGWLVRLMRTRLAPRLYWGEWPIEYVDKVAPAPLLIVHHGLDTLVPREDSETLFALARAPKDFLYLPWALHGQVMAAAMPALAWLEAKMPLSQAERASRAEEKKGAR
jgi:pimeloyl-ACP methyl ester carboxylesterase